MNSVCHMGHCGLDASGRGLHTRGGPPALHVPSIRYDHPDMSSDRRSAAASSSGRSGERPAEIPSDRIIGSVRVQHAAPAIRIPVRSRFVSPARRAHGAVL